MNKHKWGPGSCGWMMSVCVFLRVIQCVSVLCSCTINLPQSVGTAARVKLNCNLVSNNVLMLQELVHMHFVKKNKTKTQTKP